MYTQVLQLHASVWEPTEELHGQFHSQPPLKSHTLPDGTFPIMPITNRISITSDQDEIRHDAFLAQDWLVLNS